MNEITRDDAKSCAKQIMTIARDTIMMKYRFFDVSLAKYKLEIADDTKSFKVSGDKLIIDCNLLLKTYLREPCIGVRLLMHVIFHSLFMHYYAKKPDDIYLYNIACDIAVENVILELDNKICSLFRDDEQRAELMVIRKKVPQMTAAGLYKYLLSERKDENRIRYLYRLFSVDVHEEELNVQNEEEIMILEEDWKKLASKVLSEVSRFAKNVDSESLSANLKDVTTKKITYADVLSKFAILTEEIKINPDEFDYVYYTYGLRLYDKIPLIEPLEYTEDKKIRDFVVVIDTSASCSNSLISEFLTKTYKILSDSESFTQKVNIHMIAADARVLWDKVITDKFDIVNAVTNFELTGHGATDFRPAFEYVDELIRKKELENLKGLIYFTDGYGVYPEKSPSYGVVFAYTNEDINRPKAPNWATTVVVE